MLLDSCIRSSVEEYIVKMKSHSIVWSGGSGYPFGNGVGGQGDPAPHYNKLSIMEVTTLLRIINNHRSIMEGTDSTVNNL